MEDKELDSLMRKKLLEMQRRLEAQRRREKGIDPEEALNRFLVGRAWEVLYAARQQFPQITKHIEKALVDAILAEKIRKKITGEELNGLFRSLGLRVKLKTQIRVLEHGELKSLEEKLREDTK
jgi:DNA-binding TFAR19-related protein (PDSD5 family)